MRPKEREYRDPGRAADEIAHAVIGAALAVHSALGPGHLERVYERALAVELEYRGIGFQTQVPADVHYREVLVGESRIDMIIEEWVVVEIKSVERLSTIHTVQALSYLKITELPLALLLNFNVPLLKDGIRRVVPPL
jgi:GxxExxY protein